MVYLPLHKVHFTIFPTIENVPPNPTQTRWTKLQQDIRKEWARSVHLKQSSEGVFAASFIYKSNDDGSHFSPSPTQSRTKQIVAKKTVIQAKQRRLEARNRYILSFALVGKALHPLQVTISDSIQFHLFPRSPIRTVNSSSRPKLFEITRPVQWILIMEPPKRFLFIQGSLSISSSSSSLPLLTYNYLHGWCVSPALLFIAVCLLVAQSSGLFIHSFIHLILTKLSLGNQFSPILSICTIDEKFDRDDYMNFRVVFVGEIQLKLYGSRPADSFHPMKS